MTKEEEKDDDKENPIPTVSPYDVEVTYSSESENTTTTQEKIIERELLKGKRYFGSAAGSLTWMDSPKIKDNLPEGWKHEVVDLAAKAEKRTSRTILKWMRDKPAAVLIDSCHIPGVGEETVDEETGLVEGGDTDHLLVIGSHVYVIDTKFWKRRASYKVGDEGQVLRAGKEFPGGRVNIEKAVHMWFDYIDSETAELLGAVYIDSDDSKDPKNEYNDGWSTSVYRDGNWYQHPWVLLEPKRFTEWLDEQYADQAGYDKETGDEENPEDIRTIDTSIVTQIAVTCVKPYSRADGLINTKALYG